MPNVTKGGKCVLILPGLIQHVLSNKPAHCKNTMLYKIHNIHHELKLTDASAQFSVSYN